ncbi:MAG: hypothetical protein NT076_01350 [Candidatus Pacearchaeota archaeon]|nr:hypothetical protein [Candidatus Pacearchaeota archaeon]
MKIVLFVMAFLLLGVFFIVSEKNLSVRSPEARVELGKLYLGWLGQIAINSGRLTGYVVKLDWFPGNKTSG